MGKGAKWAGGIAAGIVVVGTIGAINGGSDDPGGPEGTPTVVAVLTTESIDTSPEAVTSSTSSLTIPMQTLVDRPTSSGSGSPTSAAASSKPPAATSKATVPPQTSTAKPAAPKTTAKPPAPKTPKAAPPKTTTQPSAPKTSAPVAQQAGCHPTSAAGNCYKAGQKCAKAHYGTSGVDANGATIRCIDNNGWRWTH